MFQARYYIRLRIRWFSNNLGLIKVELFTSRIKEWNISRFYLQIFLDSTCKFYKLRKRHVTLNTLEVFPLDKNILCYSADMVACLKRVGWIALLAICLCLLINQTRDQKQFFFTTQNTYPLTPIARSYQMKDQKSANILLKLIKWKDHNWDACGDYISLDLQGGYTEHSCF